MNTADKLFEEVKHLYNKEFVDKHTKKVYTFIGVLVSEDDYYYTMYSPENGIQNLSCVGSIETHGYELVDRKMNDKMEEIIDQLVIESLFDKEKVDTSSDRQVYSPHYISDDIDVEYWENRYLLKQLLAGKAEVVSKIDKKDE